VRTPIVFERDPEDALASSTVAVVDD